MFDIRPSVSGYSARRNTEDGPIEVWVETFHVEASNTRGQRWLYDNARDYGNIGAVKAVIRHLASDPAAAPDKWVETDPIYGSEAWGPEQEYELACFEADCYDEPRPRW